MTYHGKINALVVLKGIKQPNKPFTLRARQNITLRQDVPNFVQFEKEFLAHHLQSAHLTRVLLLCQIDLSIATLPHLSEDLEITLA